MSYADAAAKNADGPGAIPDPSLLERPVTDEHAGAGDHTGDKVNVVERDAGEQLQQAIDAADGADLRGEHFRAVRKQTQDALSSAQRAFNDAKSPEAKQQAKEKVDKARDQVKKLDRRARTEAKAHPIATGGLVGALNLAVVLGVGYAAYANWGKPAWDRKVVALTTAGVLAWFGSESVLGWHEYQADKKD